MFCKKCKSLLIPIKDDKGKIKFVCRKCGTSSRDKELKIKSVNSKKERLFFIDEKENNILPITKEKCPKCNHTKAYYGLIQTRAADESPTKFYKCVKCSHTWRDYE